MGKPHDPPRVHGPDTRARAPVPDGLRVRAEGAASGPAPGPAPQQPWSRVAVHLCGNGGL